MVASKRNLPVVFQKALCESNFPSSFSLSTEGKSINKWLIPFSRKNTAPSSIKYVGFVFEYCIVFLSDKLGSVLITTASLFLLPNAYCSCFFVITKSSLIFSGGIVTTSAKKKNCCKF